MRSPTLYAAAILLCTALLAGCSPFETRQQGVETAEYLLEWRPAAELPARPGGPVIQVSAPRAAAGFGSADMLYMARPHRLERFARHRWVDPPARMLEPLLVRALEASGLFAAVGTPGVPIQADLRLDSEVIYLQLRVDADAQRLQLALRVSLIAVADGRLLGSTNIDLEEVSEEATPYGGVQAANRAVSRAMERLIAFLRRQVEG